MAYGYGFRHLNGNGVCNTCIYGRSGMFCIYLTLL